MIESLRIRNLALVESAEVDFGSGFNVVTGETGAGKSLMLGALALLAGERASSESIGSSGRDAHVEALFRTERLPALEAELVARGLGAEEHGVVVSRTLAPGGRSRAQVAGRWVPVSTLRELFAGRLEISSQHASQSLRRPGAHGELLDAFAGLTADRDGVRDGVQRLRALREELAALRGAAAERLRRRDDLRFHCGEIDAVECQPGELDRLGAEQRRLGHAEELRRGAEAARAAIAGELGPEGGPPALEQLGSALRQLEAVASFDAAVGVCAGRLRGVRTELDDVALDLERCATGVEVDPEALARIEARLAELERLRRKYGGDEAAILAYRDRAAAELEQLSGDDVRIAELEGEAASLCAELTERSRRLRAGRSEASHVLAEGVEAALAGLDMAGARFAAMLHPRSAPAGFPCGPGGTEQVEFQLAANPGEGLRPLHRVASGGELSRVFLALKTALLGGSGPGGMVLVFDEVDVGIGGEAIAQVGRSLAALAGAHQVICITHWPVIAAAADRHFRVAKVQRGGRSRTRIAALDRAGRVAELARMAGGERVGQTTRPYAQELLRGGEDGAPAPAPARGRAHRPGGA